MIVLRLRLHRKGEESKIITDYLVEQRARKLWNAAVACGLEAEYDEGEIGAADFKGCKGVLRLGIERAKNGYGRRNQVIDYVVGGLNRG
jgi:hypothetical protein